MLSRCLKSLVLLVLAAQLCGCFAAMVGGAAAQAGHDRRSFRTVVNDANIELTAQNAINKDKEIALKNDVDVVVYNGTLLLIGEVRTQALRDRAEAHVSGIEDTVRVVNELEVTEPRGVVRSGRDKWITARAKTALLDIVDLPDFDPTRVNITTHNAVVYLMGLVNAEEAERVVAVVSDVPGVQKVVKVFEYTQ